MALCLGSTGVSYKVHIRSPCFSARRESHRLQSEPKLSWQLQPSGLLATRPDAAVRASKSVELRSNCSRTARRDPRHLKRSKESHWRSGIGHIGQLLDRSSCTSVHRPRGSSMTPWLWVSRAQKSHMDHQWAGDIDSMDSIDFESIIVCVLFA